MTGLEERRKHAWDYFQFHAQQRLTTFNFFIVFSSLLAGGLLTTFQEKYRAPLVGAGAGFILAIISFVFWKIDVRNKQLIKNAEATLRSVEALWQEQAPADKGPVCAVFLQDEAFITRARAGGSWKFWDRHLSYSDCFNIAYATMALGGLSVAVFVLVRELGAV